MLRWRMASCFIRSASCATNAQSCWQRMTFSKYSNPCHVSGKVVSLIPLPLYYGSPNFSNLSNLSNLSILIFTQTCTKCMKAITVDVAQVYNKAYCSTCAPLRLPQCIPSISLILSLFLPDSPFTLPHVSPPPPPPSLYLPLKDKDMERRRQALQLITEVARKNFISLCSVFYFNYISLKSIFVYLSLI